MTNQLHTHWRGGISLGTPKSGFLSRFFELKQEDVILGEKVSYDLMREDTDVAVPLPGGIGSARSNTSSGYANVDLTLPKFKEDFTVTYDSLSHRQFGEVPFSDFSNPRTAAAILVGTKGAGVKLINKLRRAMELQAAQVFQSGTITSVDSSGGTVYQLAFGTPAAHFASAGTVWSTTGTSTPTADLDAHATLIKGNSGCDVTDVVFGTQAWNWYLNSANTQNLYDKRNIQLGGIVAQAAPPEFANSGASLMGTVTLAGGIVRLWLYDATYVHPQTGAKTPYLATNKVAFVCGDAPRATVAGLPVVCDTDPRLADIIPPTTQQLGRGGYSVGFSAAPVVGEGIKLIAQSNPLQIPVNVCGLGCLTVS